MHNVTRVVAGLAVLVIAGCTDQPTAPGGHLISTPEPHLSESPPQCDPSMIICDENGGVPDVTYDYYSEDVGDVTGSASFEYTLSAAEAQPYFGLTSGSAVACPAGFAMAGVAATLYPPGEPLLPIVSSGWWAIIFGEMPVNFGRYLWPANMSAPQAEYMWPATDASGRWASIANADARCLLVVYPNGMYRTDVTFYKYNGVRIRYPSRRTNYGGGSGGGLPDCHLEYIYLEVNYGDGTGRHVIWQGYATVCG